MERTVRTTQIGMALVAFLVLLTSCVSDSADATETLRIPLGRSAVLGQNEYFVFVDGMRVEPTIESDGYGGYWALVQVAPENDSEVAVRFVVTDSSSPLDSSSADRNWLAPSAYIDAEAGQLHAASKRITSPFRTTIERAVALQSFVADALEFRAYEGHADDLASRTLELGYGTCVNHARLFVALSRAAGIPARTVWGVVYSDGVYDYHHEWAEVCDESGHWHQLDPLHSGAFDLASAEYLDLIYAAEENPFNPYEVDPCVLGEAERIAYDTSIEAYDGRLGFTLVAHDAPGRYVIEHKFPCPCAVEESAGTDG